jgi:hypothetical protein
MSNPADDLGGFLMIAFGLACIGLLFVAQGLWNLYLWLKELRK